MQNTYFSKNALSILFNETLKQNPDKKDFLMSLWKNIKDSTSECGGKCEECKFSNKCTAIGDAWEMYKRFHEVQETDDYWTEVVKASRTIMKKHGDSKFASKLVRIVLEELSDSGKEVVNGEDVGNKEKVLEAEK